MEPYKAWRCHFRGFFSVGLDLSPQAMLAGRNQEGAQRTSVFAMAVVADARQ